MIPHIFKGFESTEAPMLLKITLIVSVTMLAKRSLRSVNPVGVQMTNNVHPYEMMKIRLLNASHLLIGYLGSLAGYTENS